MTGSPRGGTVADSIFLRSLVITTVLRAILAAVVPLTGDEAYFVVWGEFPDAGYYDHTPMVGWWLAAVLSVGKTVWLVRLPALLTTIGIALLIWRVARQLDVEKAGYVGALYAWSPHNVLNFFTTTDTPLLLFTALSGVWVFRASRTERALDYFLGGVFLGLAFLSKYFAVLLGLSFAVLLLACVKPSRWLALFLLFAGTIPSIAINIAWNREHGWTNILFNLFNRTRDAGFSVGSMLEYAAIVVLPVAPIVWRLLKPGTAGRERWSRAWTRWRESGALVFAVAFIVPIGALLGVSSVKPVGAQWPVAFFPFFFLAIVAVFPMGGLRRLMKPMVVLGGALCAVSLVAVSLPVELLRRHKSYDSIVLGTHVDEVLDALAPYRGDAMLATPSYAKSAMLSFHSGSHVPVIGPGSHHGRQDDLITDIRTWDGRDIVILYHRPDRARLAEPWFESVEFKTIDVRGAEFSIVVGHGFKYPEYRDEVIRPLAMRHYRMPWWLASWSRPSFFFTRYGLPEEESILGSAGSQAAAAGETPL